MAMWTHFLIPQLRMRQATARFDRRKYESPPALPPFTQGVEDQLAAKSTASSPRFLCLPLLWVVGTPARSEALAQVVACVMDGLLYKATERPGRQL